MYQIMTADEAMELINDGDVIALNSFLGIDNPVELHEALYKRYQRTGSPKHLTTISSAGFGAWDENRGAEGYNLPLGCISHAIRAQAGGLPGRAVHMSGCKGKWRQGHCPGGQTVARPSRPHNTIIPGCLVDAIVEIKPEPRHASYESLTGSFEIPYSQWQD